MYTEKGTVYLRVPDGLIDYDVPIPKAKTVIGPYEKGDNVRANALVCLYNLRRCICFMLSGSN